MAISRYLCTGGAGSIGSELVRKLAVSNAVHVFDSNETAMFDLVEELRLKGLSVTGEVGDVRDKEALRRAFASFRPDGVFVVSAYKHVTPMEQTPMQAVSVNIEGTWNAVELAQDFEAKLVFVSTDKAATSNCVMGATKRVAELIVKNAGFVSVRFGNVLGSRGSVIPIWQAQMDKGEALTVTDPKMERFMMTTPQAAELVIAAYHVGKPGEILILDMGEPVNVYELAKDIIAKSGKNPGIRMIGTRPGEVLTEVLMTEDEKKRSVRKEGFIVVPPLP